MYPYPQRQKQPQQAFSSGFDVNASPAAPPAISSSTTPAKGRPSGPAAKDAPTQKNRYPCPVAKKYNCNDYFTTSGHAARHAKKHTGRKDSFCPECNKAFTRKDNMEQHRRTHQNGRKASKESASAVAAAVEVRRMSKVASPVVETAAARSSSSRRPKPLPIQAQIARPTHDVPLSPRSAYSVYPDPMHAAPDPYPTDPLLTSGYAASPYPSLSHRTPSTLDTLAYVASETMRRDAPY
jgi:hypothetical protein